MQTLLATVIVLGAVAYVAWQWAPAQWREALRRRDGAPVAADALPRRSSACSACSTCGACAKARG